MLPAGRVAAVAVAGGVLGAALDQLCHVRLGVLYYPNPVPGLFDQPWWVAPQFAAATLVTILATVPFARASRSIAREPWTSPIVTGLIWLIAAYLASGVFSGDRFGHHFGHHPIALTAALGGLFLLRIAFRRERWLLLGGGLVLAAGGCAYEILISRAGAFVYNRPDWVVPMWLPGVYLHAAPLAIAITQALDRPKLSTPARV